MAATHFGVLMLAEHQAKKGTAILAGVTDFDYYKEVLLMVDNKGRRNME